MVWRNARYWALLAGSLLLGCMQEQTRYPPDPLLLCRRPTLVTADEVESAQIVRHEPTAPAPPQRALALAPADIRELVLAHDPHRLNEAHLAGSPTRLASSQLGTKGPLLVFPASRQGDKGGAPEIPLGPRKVPGRFGHASNFAWLQGEIRMVSEGRFALTYQEVSPRKTESGSLLLEQDPRLAWLKPGDLVVLEGERIPENDPKAKPASKPSYRVHTLWRVQPATPPSTTTQQPER